MVFRAPRHRRVTKMNDNKSMIISAALMHGLGMHLGAWMARDGDVADYVSGRMYKDIARVAERGKLHALFLAEQLTNQENGVERPCGTLDTIATLALMAAVTDHIGLVGTASTTYNQPYELARRFATLDHLSGGRVGWNSIATQNPHTVEQFGGGAHPDNQARYELADEFIEVVLALWDSWEQGALVGDKANRVFGRADMVRDQAHDPLAIGGGHRPAAILKPPRQPVYPKPAVGVEHHLDDRRVFEEAGDGGTERGAQHARTAGEGLGMKWCDRHDRPRHWPIARRD